MSKKKEVTIATIIMAVIAVVCIAFAFIGHDEYSKYTSKEYLELGKYKGLTYTKMDTKLGKDDVSTRIDSDLAGKATPKEVKTGTVNEGDTIVLNFKGTVDGKEFDGCESENRTTSVGTGDLPFDKDLAGVKIGEEKTFKAKLNQDYPDKDVRGKEAEYKVTVLHKTEYIKPKYDEAFAKEMGFKSKKEYEKAVEEELKKAKEDSVKMSEEYDVFNQVMNGSDLKKNPDKLVDEEYERLVKQYKNMAKNQYNAEWDEFLQTYLQQSKKEFKASMQATAQANVKERLVIHAIAKNEKIKVSDKEYKDYLKKLLKNSGLSEEEFEKQYGETLEEYAKENLVREDLLREKVLEFLLENSKAK